jgi:hypothetical protein
MHLKPQFFANFLAKIFFLKDRNIGRRCTWQQGNRRMVAFLLQLTFTRGTTAFPRTTFPRNHPKWHFPKQLRRIWPPCYCHKIGTGIQFQSKLRNPIEPKISFSLTRRNANYSAMYIHITSTYHAWKSRKWPGANVVGRLFNIFAAKHWRFCLKCCDFVSNAAILSQMLRFCDKCCDFVSKCCDFVTSAAILWQMLRFCLK